MALVVPSSVEIALVDALLPFGESVRSFFDLLFVRLVQYRAEDLLNPHRRLPSYPLLLLCGPVMSAGGE